MFYRKGNRPVYDRQDGETVDKKAFDAQSGILVERDDGDLLGQGALRGPAERSLDFFRWLVLTFTLERTTVIDIFAGCGGLGVVCAERHRHCFCVDYDRPVFDRHLHHFGDIHLTPVAATAKDADEDTDWERYEPSTMAPTVPTLAEITLLKTMKKAHIELSKIKWAIQAQNEKKTRYEEQENTDVHDYAISCTFQAMGLLEKIMGARGHPELSDVDMLELEFPNCMGYWRTFEIISEDDEGTYRTMADEIVARYRPAT